MVSQLRVLIVAKGDVGSGNLSSAARIRRTIANVEKRAVCDFLAIGRPVDGDLLEAVLSRNPEVVIAIHLRRCAFLENLPTSIPLILICGGTDVNEDVTCSERLQSMTNVVQRSKAVVFFSDSMRLQFLASFAHLGDTCRFWTIPQAVELLVEPATQDDVRSQLGLQPDQKFFIVVGRLRSVKDPCFIIAPFQEWQQTRLNGQFILLFVGALETRKDERCPGFVEEVQRCHSSVKHVDTLSTEDCQRAMRSAVALINCSRSEGQSGAILEAMALGTPVLARDISGNRDLVIHEETGLLFHDTKTFCEGLSRLADEPHLRQKLKEAAQSMVTDKHSPLREGQSYCEVIQSVLAP